MQNTGLSPPEDFFFLFFFFSHQPAVKFGSNKQSHVVFMRICFGKMNLCIGCQCERENMMRGKRHRKCVFERDSVRRSFFFLLFFWTKHQNSGATRQLVLFASCLTQTRVCLCAHTRAGGAPVHQITQTQRITHPSFMADCTQSWTSLCKWQLICAREEKGG